MRYRESQASLSVVVDQMFTSGDVDCTLICWSLPRNFCVCVCVLNLCGWSQPWNYVNSEIFPIYGMIYCTMSLTPHILPSHSSTYIEVNNYQTEKFIYDVTATIYGGVEPGSLCPSETSLTYVLALSKVCFTISVPCLCMWLGCICQTHTGSLLMSSPWSLSIS